MGTKAAPAIPYLINNLSYHGNYLEWVNPHNPRLRGGTFTVNSMAEDALVSIGPTAVPALLSAYNNSTKDDKDGLLRQNVILTLQKINDQRAIPTMLKALNEEPINGWGIRLMAIEFLAGFSDKVGSEIFLTYSTDENRKIRRVCVQALAMIKDEKAIEALTKISCQDECADIRNDAAKILELIIRN
jgi:HEAT repeat protein